MNTQFNHSLAGTGRQYVVGQVTPAFGGLHIQIAGPNSNRNYGFAVNVDTEPDLKQFVLNQAATKNSLATGKLTYRPAQFDTAYGNVVKIQVPGSDGNRDYGYTANIESKALFDYLTSVIQPAISTPVTNEPVKAHVVLTWQDETELEQEPDDDSSNQETAQEMFMELEESLNGLAGLVKAAKEELAQLKSKIG